MINLSEKSRILDMLQEGKITPNQAVMLLEALGEKNAEEITKNYQRTEKKTDFDEKASKIIDDLGKKFNYFIENLGHYVSEGLGKVSDFSNSFAGRRYRFEDKVKGVVKDGATIKIRSNGPIDIRGIDSLDGEFTIELIKMIREEDEKKAEIIAKEAVEIKSSTDEIILNLVENRELWLEMVIYLPRNFMYNLEIHSVNGRLNLDDLDLTTANLETVNGRILVERCDAGILNLTTLNGSIDIAGNFKVLEAATHNGSVEYSLEESDTKASVKSTNGPVRVRLPINQSFDYNIEATTGWGKMIVDLPLKDLKVNRDGDNYLQATTMSNLSFPKDRAIQLKAVTSNGSITIVPLD